MWAGQIEPFSKAYKLITWDMRGHGQSDYPADQAAYTEAETVADIAAILDAVGARQAVVAGLSLGGYMSMAFNLLHPDRVLALLIIDTGPGYKNDEARANWNTTAIGRADRFETQGLPTPRRRQRRNLSRGAPRRQRRGQGGAGHAHPARRVG